MMGSAYINTAPAEWAWVRPYVTVGRQRYYITGTSRAERSEYHLRWLHRPEIRAARMAAYADDERAGNWRPDFTLPHAAGRDGGSDA